MHQESIKHSSVVPIVVEAVDQALVSDGLLRIGSPYDALVEVRHANSIYSKQGNYPNKEKHSTYIHSLPGLSRENTIFVIELEEQCVQALGQVVHRARIGGMQNFSGSATWKDDIEITLGYLPTTSTVAVHTCRLDEVNYTYNGLLRITVGLTHSAQMDNMNV